MDRFQEMTVFQAVADAGGFASAGLESRIGARLLVRSTRNLRLTDAGERYLNDCRHILSELDEADASAAGSHARPKGQLAVTAPVLFGESYVTPVIAAYLAAFPDVSVQALLLDRVVSMHEEGIDVGIRIGDLPDSSRHAVRVQPRLLVNANQAAIAAAMCGVGFARLLSYQIATQLQDGALKVVLKSFEPAPLPVHVVYREGVRASAKVRSFVDLCVTRLREYRAFGISEAD